MNEHEYARVIVNRIEAAKNDQGNKKKIHPVIIDSIRRLLVLYPQHAQKEDEFSAPLVEHFFIQSELESLMNEFKTITAKYDQHQEETLLKKYQ